MVVICISVKKLWFGALPQYSNRSFLRSVIELLPVIVLKFSGKILRLLWNLNLGARIHDRQFLRY